MKKNLIFFLFLIQVLNPTISNQGIPEEIRHNPEWVQDWLEAQLEINKDIDKINDYYETSLCIEIFSKILEETNPDLKKLSLERLSENESHRIQVVANFTKSIAIWKINLFLKLFLIFLKGKVIKLSNNKICIFKAHYPDLSYYFCIDIFLKQNFYPFMYIIHFYPKKYKGLINPHSEMTKIIIEAYTELKLNPNYQMPKLRTDDHEIFWQDLNSALSDNITWDKLPDEPKPKTSNSQGKGLSKDLKNPFLICEHLLLKERCSHCLYGL